MLKLVTYLHVEYVLTNDEIVNCSKCKEHDFSSYIAIYNIVFLVLQWNKLLFIFYLSNRPSLYSY